MLAGKTSTSSWVLASAGSSVKDISTGSFLSSSASSLPALHVKSLPTFRYLYSTWRWIFHGGALWDNEVMCKRYGCALEAFVPSFQYARLNRKGFRVGNRRACLGRSLQCFRAVHWRFPCLREHVGRSVPVVFVSYLQMALPHIEHRCCVQPKRKCFQIASQIRTSIVNACREDLYIVLSVGFSRIFRQGHFHRLFPFLFSLFFVRLGLSAHHGEDLIIRKGAMFAARLVL